MSHPDLRALPSVDRVVRDFEHFGLPRAVVTAIVRRELDSARATILAGGTDNPAARIQSVLATLVASKLRPVINATGILIHTNLGRSPLSAGAIGAIVAAAGGYTNLEFDLTTGTRRSRAAYLEQTLAVLCSAQAAVAVNNCAAALLLMVQSALSPGKNAVVISRGELVQIGGGFRVHEILQSAGVTLIEVGATNRTTADDYRRAMTPSVAAILKVHRANFFMDGFVGSPTIFELAVVAVEAGVVLLEDLGSGATDAFNSALLAAGSVTEPTPSRSLSQGVDLVCFSGDKLLGGPQAGIVAGKKAAVDALKKHPLFRAMRCDKLVLAGLSATVEEHLNGQDSPVLTLLKTPLADLKLRAESICRKISTATVLDDVGMIGGGALPRTSIPSVTVQLAAANAEAVAARLRAGAVPVVGYVKDGAVRLNLRTVLPAQDRALIETIQQAITA